MLDKIVCYNNYHKGDLHVSRSLIRFVIENISAKEYIYYHHYTPKILQDIPKLKQKKYDLPKEFNYRGWVLENNILFLNSWYNAYNQQEFKGCTIQTLFNIFKRGLKETIDFDLPGEANDYLPVIDYNYFDLSSITSWLSCDKREKVLISNCNVLSGQSHNFDFNPVIDYISDTFPEVCFIITNIMNNKVIHKQNVYYFQDIFSDGDCDLNEISYISKFCNIIIGRNSGPHTFCFTKENLFDPMKTFICISHESFGILGSVNAEIVCSQRYSLGDVSAIIEETVKRKIK